jgi:hypothetical protein
MEKFIVEHQTVYMHIMCSVILPGSVKESSKESVSQGLRFHQKHY